MPDISFHVDSTALEIVRNTQISANFEEVEAQLKEMIAPYRTMVVTADGISNAKADRARIRKVEKELDDYRKAVKNAYMSQYNDFDKKMRSLADICKEGSDNIDFQVKQFEERQKAEKIAGLREYFDQNSESVRDYLTFDQIFNKRWENATFAVEDAIGEILTAIANCKDGIEAIRGLNSPFEAELLSSYAKTHDLAACMKKHSELTEIKRREEERRRAAEEARKQAEIEAEARRKAQAEAEARIKAEKEAEMAKFIASAPKIEQEKEPEPEQEEIKKPQETVYSLTFRVEATKSQLNGLKAACDSLGITIKRV